MFVALAFASTLAYSSAFAQTKLRYAHVGVANAPQTIYADEVAKLVKERTSGRIEIQVFPNSQLGGVGEMVDGIKAGAIAMGHPIGASAARVIVDTTRELRRLGGGIGIAAACIGVGQAIAVAVEV